MWDLDDLYNVITSRGVTHAYGGTSGIASNIAPMFTFATDLSAPVTKIDVFRSGGGDFLTLTHGKKEKEKQGKNIISTRVSSSSSYHFHTTITLSCVSYTSSSSGGMSISVFTLDGQLLGKMEESTNFSPSDPSTWAETEQHAAERRWRASQVNFLFFDK